MNMGIFIDDFERTEYSEQIHAMLGRALIIATRFDSMCDTLAKAYSLKQNLIISALSEEEWGKFVKNLISKFTTLNNNINSFKLPNEISKILHKARKSRNEIAHSVTKGLEGCLDIRLKHEDLIKTLKKLVGDIADGDMFISILISKFNGDPILNQQSLSTYKDEIINWVIDP